jgi:hypothetical protein
MIQKFCDVMQWCMFADVSEELVFFFFVVSVVKETIQTVKIEEKATKKKSVTTYQTIIFYL